MFTDPQAKGPATGMGLWIGVIVIVILGAGLLYYVNSQGSAKGPASAAMGAAAVPAGKSDPAKDLKVLSAKMDKDYTGTTAMWLVRIENNSTSYTYSQIEYEASYMGADNSVLLVNRAKIPVSIGPGEQQSPEFRDALYPTGTAWYKFRVTGATASVR